MSVLSKAAPSIERSLGILRSMGPLTQSIRSSHARLFVKRPAQLIVNRIKDITHFYIIGIGILPVLVCLIYNHIIYGPCELKDYPTEGPPPHYWQYERTPIRQWWAKHFGVSDIEHHERQLAYFERNSILQRWRQMEDRVRHLEGERWDYKAWTYQPVSSSWVDLGRWQALKMRDQYEEHGHYTY
ncbi:hypothetical protein AB6A40_001443 [Gnathostoma spinigerum]|uniref:NADH dehydrogenase [ubiquinone] 1 beta subcomplex subunit 5, mitochondrial n=1 Tax=Gnathostoma spinigerum TaxID=75299 RepID=A0ABD6EBK9_9BILA